MFDTRKVAREIREARIARNMTQMNLADEIGVSCQAVSNWERGSSMPDIGKLEDLCQILHINLDQLLGVTRQVENVQKVMDYTHGKTQETPSLEAIKDAAPLLKPDTLNQFAGEIPEDEMNPAELCGLAPFLSRETLRKLADKVTAITPEELCGLAPFLDKSSLGNLAARLEPAAVKLEELCGLAPFLERETLNNMAAQIKAETAQLGALCGLAPFLDKGTLSSMASGIETETVKLGELCSLAPFLEREVLSALSEKIPDMEIHLDEIWGLAPFLERETLERLIKRKYQ